MITRYLPKFNQMEPNLLLGLTAGQVVSQVPVDMAHIAKVTKEGVNFIENGILCTLNDQGKIVSYADTVETSKTNNPLFIHFTEELNTFLDERRYFAVEEAPDKEKTYIRLVALTPGSEWTTTIGSEDVEEYAAYTAAINAKKIVCINDDVKMPDGTPAHTYRCIG